MSSYEDEKINHLLANKENLKKFLKEAEKTLHNNYLLGRKVEKLEAQVSKNIGTHFAVVIEAVVFDKKIVEWDIVEGVCEEKGYDYISDLDILMYLYDNDIVKKLENGLWRIYLEIQTAWIKTGWEAVEYDADPVITYQRNERIEKDNV